MAVANLGNCRNVPYAVPMSRDYVLRPFQSGVQLAIDYARELNPQQYAAVTAPPGAALVIAGAGSGKTRTLTYRVAYLLEQGIPPDRILLLTFTNKAATEMMRRVTELLGRELTSLWGGTFHSIGNRVLRLHAPQLGFGRDFTILDREDARHLIGTCVTEAQIDIKTTRFPKPEVLGDLFSLATNRQQAVTEILDTEYRHLDALGPQIMAVARDYRARKRAANAMDFDDLLHLWLELLQTRPEIRELYQRRFQFILVDEYQDTNKLQSDLIDLLANRTRNVMAVGDDAQSIYAWRGADFHNILKFTARYPSATIYRIETNYRSTPEILRVANAAIAANTEQFAKVLTAARPRGSKPVLVACQDAGQQAAFVAQRALELRDEGVPLHRMAVLYRSHFHALELQLELTRHNIPFSITSGIRFFEQAHIKDLAAYLKFVTNPRDELSFKRLVLLLPGIGGKSAAKLWHHFSAAWPAAGAPPRDEEHPGEGVAASAPPASPLATALQRCATIVPRKTSLPWAQFVTTIAQLEPAHIRSQAASMIAVVLEAGYEDYLKQNFSNHRSRLDDLKQLAVFSQQFPTVTEFLTQMALLTNLEAESGQPAPDPNDEKIRLSTIHQAKGLEFDVVFGIMLCDGLFPSARSLETAAGLEEERRLFYVTITRAKNELYLCHPLLRAGFGGEGVTLQSPSRFLEEIPRDLLEEWNLRAYV